MYICIYVYIYACIYVYVCIYILIYVRMYILFIVCMLCSSPLTSSADARHASVSRML